MIQSHLYSNIQKINGNDLSIRYMIKIDSQFLNPFIRRLTRARVCLRIENLLLQNVSKILTVKIKRQQLVITIKFILHVCAQTYKINKTSLIAGNSFFRRTISSQASHKRGRFNDYRKHSLREKLKQRSEQSRNQ